jgi:hypothetical protein
MQKLKHSMLLVIASQVVAHCLSSAACHSTPHAACHSTGRWNLKFEFKDKCKVETLHAACHCITGSCPLLVPCCLSFPLPMLLVIPPAGGI